ncbi:uncharacterized protein LOC113770515 [Coffea eugenioides]|uniref:uncharacterized protein LOC113770515 n=1 Tax=Coffea eugenioides TaxID=49369 RepID=UPI000F60F843|nr:uncharacterized protein LOC113770515 [Coffea eugenioides]
MSQAIQSEGSNLTQVLPAKRKRGRPRKDQSLNRVGLARVPPGFEGIKENKSRKADKFDDKDNMVGQAVAGVVEASFDAGYLLTVRIGNSHTILRGVVFKPGHYVPVTSQNDVAPHVQMIQRSEVSLPLYNQMQSSNPSRERNDIHGSSSQIANMVVKKGISTSPTAGPSFPPVGSRGNVVPVVLQPLGPTNGPLPGNQVILDGSPSKGREVVTVEPLAMLRPDESASSSQFQVATNQQQPSQVQTSNQVRAGSVPIENGLYSEVVSVVGHREEAQEVKRTSVPTPGEPLTGSQGSSQSSETHVDNDKSSAGTSQMESDQEIGDVQLPSDLKPMNNHGKGRMTELLQALQENFDNQMPQAEPSAGSGADSQEKLNPETCGKDERTNE